MTPEFIPLGDSAVRVKLVPAASPELHRAVLAFDRALTAAPPPGAVEWVPGYTSVTVHYRPHEVRFAELRRSLTELAARSASAPPPAPGLFELPVLYGGEAGPDLADLAALHGLAPERVVELHSGTDYYVYMLGFAPGFPYLGDLPTELATPRLATPRTAVPAGSVGIGGTQTGVYPLCTPGGWRLIGRTPAALYDARRTPPALLEPGCRVRFRPVKAEEYAELERRARAGSWRVERRAYDRTAAR